ncbi:MAG TPA: YlbE-like family protein [Bacilli bacterium]|nr:YlbE-like family protein [Bacilli bacterium]
MDVGTQYKIKNNQNLKKYLRENSYLYKYLNRGSISLQEIEFKMKEAYKITSQDKFNRFINNINMISKFMDMVN